MQQTTIPIHTACQITERVLVMMKAWLEEKKSKGFEEDSHPARTDMAITSCHHARLLINVFLREMILKERAMATKK